MTTLPPRPESDAPSDETWASPNLGPVDFLHVSGIPMMAAPPPPPSGSTGFDSSGPDGLTEPQGGPAAKRSVDLERSIPNEQTKNRQPLLIWISFAFVAVVVGGTVFGLSGGRSIRNSSGAVSGGLAIPNVPPASLDGLPANPQGLGRNSEWQTYATHLATGSSTSFASVYGIYPPVADPTIQTFFVFAAQPYGGPGNVDEGATALINKFRSAASQTPGASVTYLSPRPSTAGGQIYCIGVSVPTGVQGECDWASNSSVVDVFTFSNQLPVIRGLTEKIVSELQG